MTNIYLHENFLSSAMNLPKTQKNKISKFLKQFQENPNHPSINLHSVGESMQDHRVKGARLDDSYRVIVLPSEAGLGYVFLYVDKHDLAYDWAKSKKFELKNKNGYFQISDQYIEDHETDVKTKLFDGFSDKELYDAGIDESDIETIRRIENKESLIVALKYFDPMVQSVLSLMADGLEVDEALEKSINELKPSDSESIVKLEVDETTLDQLDKANPDRIIKFEVNNDWDQFFSGTLEQWRIFLHPTQTNLVNASFSGPFQITGSAGTGKTVVLLHRALRYLKENENKKILFLTFTANLTVEIRSLLQKLIESSGLNQSLINNVEITSLYRFSETINLKTGWKGTIVSRSDDRVIRIWKDVTNEIESSLGLTKDELIDEYYEIKEQKGIFEIDSYLTAVRKGKSKLSRENRKIVWNYFEKFESELRKRSLRTPEQSIHESRLYAERNPSIRFTHVFVDEIQDMSVEALKLIKSLSGYDQEPKNGITLAGDLNQRVYRSTYQPIQAGIQIQGRSHRLRYVYRTTEQIRVFAEKLIEAADINANDWNDSRKGDIANHLGSPPEIYPSSNWELITTEINSKLAKWESEGYKQNEICILYSDGNTLSIENPIERLRKSGLPIFELSAFQEDRPDIAGYRLGTIKRTKGLEFRCVILIVSIGENILTSLNNLGLHVRCELYVGSSRARENLVVFD
ncbi:UvrD-helicase domain-containing protein [Leptospira sp. 201903075]|uniref:UvrD-helicase domain-containing protein n=1 Tax=Leptospira chreensis TaxID=2810035 RepID=UPI0019649B0B|nr:UvrD-helicase domain-containing protein [Leptospira chreensis]MBM9592361.1 UvrD-helicase domain-containing protein [Leptospira chreensis]